MLQQMIEKYHYVMNEKLNEMVTDDKSQMCTDLMCKESSHQNLLAKYCINSVCLCFDSCGKSLPMCTPEKGTEALLVRRHSATYRLLLILTCFMGLHMADSISVSDGRDL